MSHSTTNTWRMRDRTLDLSERVPVMGIVNVTPDSFSDGGEFHDANAAVEHGLRLHREGAAILDIGGESTRPGAQPVSAEEELRRVIPVIRGLRDAVPELLISIDTSKAAVAEAALEAGAVCINDVTAGRGDPDMFSLAAKSGAGLALMHMRGTPRTMQAHPEYRDVVAEVNAFLAERLQAAEAAGVDPERIVLDPGIGFGKTLEHNLTLIRNLERIREPGRPLLLGVSRKRWLGEITGRDVSDRLAASLAGAMVCKLHGAQILRVHDVIETCDMLKIVDKVYKSTISCPTSP